MEFVLLNTKLDAAQAPFHIIVHNKKKRRYTLQCKIYKWHTTTRHEDNVFTKPDNYNDISDLKVNPKGMYCKLCDYPKVALQTNKHDYDRYLRKRFNGSRVDEHDPLNEVKDEKGKEEKGIPDDPEESFPANCKTPVTLRCRVEAHSTFTLSPLQTGFKYNKAKPGKTKQMSRYQWCPQCKSERIPWDLEMMKHVVDADNLPQRVSHGRVEVHHKGWWSLKCKTPECPYISTLGRKNRKYQGLCIMCSEYA